MKNFRCFTAILLIATMFISFNACSSDDDDEENNSQNGKRLSKVTMYNSDNSINDSFIFSYTNGKLSKITFEEDEPFNISYSNNNVIISGEYKQNLYLNNIGFAESGTLIFDASPYKFTCEYSNGYLTKVNYPDSEYNVRIEIEYDSNGNISTAYQYADNGYSDCKYPCDNISTENEVIEFKFTLSSYSTKGKNMFLLGNLFSSDETLDLFYPAYYAGLLGKDFSNLVSKVECIGKYDSYVIEYDYSFDKDGYIETMTEKDGNKIRRTLFTYE